MGSPEAYSRLYEEHVALGGRMVDFGGWALPTQYDSILKEHAHVREAAGLFDVSHMGEIAVTGAGAKEFVHSILRRTMSCKRKTAKPYTAFCATKTAARWTI